MQILKLLGDLRSECRVSCDTASLELMNLTVAEWQCWDLNSRPSVWQSSALITELPPCQEERLVFLHDVQETVILCCQDVFSDARLVMYKISVVQQVHFIYLFLFSLIWWIYIGTLNTTIFQPHKCDVW